jgi:ribose transport system ATP-binding protein
VINGTDVPAGRPKCSMAAGAGFLPADRKVNGGIMGLSARENLTLANLRPFWTGLRLRRSRETAETAKWFSELAVRPKDAAEQELVRFSGGNQQKVLLAKWLRREPSVLLLDEPTQGVDIGAKIRLHRRLIVAAAQGLTIIVSSSDFEELATLCTRVLIIRAGRIAHELTGELVTAPEITRRVLAGADLSRDVTKGGTQ